MARSRRQVIQRQGSKARRGRRGGGRRGQNRGKAVNKFLRPRTGREAGKVANAQAGAEYNPAIRQLRQDAKGSAKREQDIGAWFNQLAAEYAAAQEQGNAAFQTAQGATAAQLAEAASRGQADLKELADRDEAFAKLVGGPKDTEGSARQAAAAAAAERSRVAMQEPIRAEQANFLAALGGRRTASRLQGIEERKSERDRRMKIRSDLMGTRQDKGKARVANKEKIRESDRAERSQRISEKLAKREFSDPKPYDEAILAQAQMGLQGDLASARAQTGAAGIYAGADRRTAKATERAARAAERGRKATARSQKAVARTYGKDKKTGGYNTREAQALLSSAGKAFKTPQAAVNYLVNRGVKIGTARAAVKRATGGDGGGGARRQGNRGTRGALPTPYAPTKKGRKAARQAAKRRKLRRRR